MKDHRSVALSLAIFAVLLFVKSGFAYWMQGHIVPIYETMRVADEYPSAERFPENVRFSIILFGILGVATAATAVGVLVRQHWARWVWIVICTVLSFSYLFTLLLDPEIATKQYDLILLCIWSWVLLRGTGLSQSNAP